MVLNNLPGYTAQWLMAGCAWDEAFQRGVDPACTGRVQVVTALAMLEALSRSWG